MQIVIEIEKERDKYAKRQRLYGQLIILSFVLFLVAITLGVLFSPENYGWLQWLLIGVATLYIWGMIYFISVPYKVAKQYAAFFRGYTRQIVEHETFTVVGFEGDRKINKSGLEVSTLKVTFADKTHTYERDVYVFNDTLKLEAGAQIKAHLFANVLLAYEVISL
jgi:hypothetical protein